MKSTHHSRRWTAGLSTCLAVVCRVLPGVRGLFSKDYLNLGSVQNCRQTVVKPWHHRREAEGGRVMALSSLVVSKPRLHRRRVRRGLNRNWSLRKAASRYYRRVGAHCRIHHNDVGKDEPGRKETTEQKSFPADKDLPRAKPHMDWAIQSLCVSAKSAISLRIRLTDVTGFHCHTVFARVASKTTQGRS
jgi:hypothetical protein